MENSSTINNFDTPCPQKNDDYKIDIQMNKINNYIVINVVSNVSKYKNELKLEDFSAYKNFKNEKHIKNIYEDLKFSSQKGKLTITKIGNVLQITFNTQKYGIVNIDLFEEINDPKPPSVNNINDMNTPPNNYSNIIDEIRKEHKKNLEDIQKQHKLEIDKIEKDYNEAINEMKNQFATVLNSIRREFENEMNEFKKEMKKNATNLIPINNNIKLNQNSSNQNVPISTDSNNMNLINSLTNEVNELKKKIALLESLPNKKDFELIKSWINPNKNMNFELIYSMKENGDDVTNFHNICDNIPNTLTILEIENGKKIGGYTTLDWSGNGESKNDKETFIFDLTNKKKYPKINKKRSIFCLENRGPCFGQACDLGIFNPMTRGWSNKNGSFIVNQEISDGKDNFDINELEIYKVVFE